MEVFINKMRRLQGIRKMILIEEAWKAIAKEGMVEYIKCLFKTVRKFFGEAIVVTQEVDDIIASPIVKESIINNSDCKILLDQRKYMNCRFNRQSYKKETKAIWIKATFAVSGLTYIEFRVIYYRIID